MAASRILCVGLACLDELLYCENYPTEDSCRRILDRKQRPGGNAANNCAVLAELNVKCDLFATFNATTVAGSFVKRQLESAGVNMDNCEFVDDCELPISTCIINTENGSRTILHYGDEWPDVSFEAFLKLDLSRYSWVHLEVRNCDQLRKIIQRIHEWNSGCTGSGKNSPIRISIEVEHYQDESLEFMCLADLVVVSKDFSRDLGYHSMSEALDGLYKHLKPGATLVVPWGEQGAAARGPGGDCASPGFPPARVLDTLGAGDAFCAALVSALDRGRPLDRSLEYACRVAGAKVGIHGYRGLRALLQEEGISL